MKSQSVISVVAVFVSLSASIAGAQNRARTEMLPQSSNLFSAVTQAYENKFTDCTYVPAETNVATFQKEHYCGGVAISFCFATMNCKTDQLLGATPIQVKRGCPTVAGKCPANPKDCLETRGFVTAHRGADAIGNGSAAPEQRSAPRAR